jgi:hypothetical protein
MDDPAAEKRRRKNERLAARKRQRYAEEPEFRERTKATDRRSRRKNKDATNARLRERYATDPEFRAIRRAQKAKSGRKAALKGRYGMSLEEYDAKLAAQGGVCVICRKPKEERLDVDHNHKARKLRSLLCGNCNRGLGLYGEDPAAMRRAADYLDYWQWRHANPGNTGSPPFPLSSLHRLFDPSLPCDPNLPLDPNLPTIQSPPLTGENMTPTDQQTEDDKAEPIPSLVVVKRPAR